MILVTGGCGFIGAQFVLDCVQRAGEEVINLDALTYAARPERLAALEGDRRYRFIHGDISDRHLVDSILADCRPRAIVHLAAETHVDRAIENATVFAQTNTIGTLMLLQASQAWLAGQAPDSAARFRFLHCSTDEVFGSLDAGDPPCDENAPCRPRNPYAASKAAAEHFVNAFHTTHGLPALITRATNTYGPQQHPEKLIPLAIECLLRGEPVPLYGDGRAVRDWLYVNDHVAALQAVLQQGRPGQSYHIAGAQAMTNLALVERLIEIFDAEIATAPPSVRTGVRRAMPPSSWPQAANRTGKKTRAGAEPRTVAAARIRHVADRPGHDLRYALSDRRLRMQSGWEPRTSLEDGLRATVRARLRPAHAHAASPA